MSEPAADGLLNAGELAELLHVTRRWVEEHTRLHEIPHVRLGRYPHYQRERVLEWLEKQEQGGAPLSRA